MADVDQLIAKRRRHRKALSRKDRATLRCVGIAIFAVLGLVLLGIVCLFLPDPKPKRTIGDMIAENKNTGPSTWDAYDAACDAVRHRLKSPNSAKFPSVIDKSNVRVWKQTDGSFSVSAWVEATNSFGGEIRTSFSAVVRPGGSGWRVESLQLDR